MCTECEATNAATVWIDGTVHWAMCVENGNGNGNQCGEPVNWKWQKIDLWISVGYTSSDISIAIHASNHSAVARISAIDHAKPVNLCLFIRCVGMEYSLKFIMHLNEWNCWIFFPNWNFFHFHKNFNFFPWRLFIAADDCLINCLHWFHYFILTTQTIKCLFNYLDFNIALSLYVPSYINFCFLKAATFV